MVKWFPKTGWIGKYLKYTHTFERGSEIPPVFNFFTSVGVISAVLQRNVYFQRDLYKLYPAMLIALIAPTGRGKKTTAINIGLDIVKEIKSVRIISEQITPEALVMALVRKGPVLRAGKIVEEDRDATGLLVLPELSVFLEKRDYRSGLVPLITRLADSPEYWSSETICRGEVALKNVALSMLAGSASSWLSGSIPLEAFTGGFMARFLFIVSDGSTIPVAFPKPLDTKLRDSLVRDLSHIAKFRGEVNFAGEDEKAYFQEWYDNQYVSRSFDEKEAAYQERKHDHMLRLAMILAISDRRMEVTIPDMENAINILDENERKMFELFGEIEGKQTPVGENVQVALRFIRKRGQVGRSELLKNMFPRGISAGMLTELIDTLIEAKLVKAQIVKNKEKGRDIVIYKYIGPKTKTFWRRRKE